MKTSVECNIQLNIGITCRFSIDCRTYIAPFEVKCRLTKLNTRLVVTS